MAPASLRPFQGDDEAAVASLWHRSGLDAYPYLPTWQAFTAQEAARVLHSVILPTCELWVAQRDRSIVGYLALQGSCVDRLYVDPPAQGTGVGTLLLRHATALRPQGLELHTHQQNTRARALYEQHGFVAVRFGVSPPPESAPDVEYRWRPGAHPPGQPG
ncbi:MAG: GNAT family N-acetyltransferase [Pseudomonadales bacterium]